MTDMAVNKVVYGGNTLIDLSEDTVTADKLLSGYTAHDKSGVKITGTANSGGGDSGIQAQHITSASEAITISGTGTVKVWGFGYYSASTYSKTRYAFVGDGYYLGGGYGAPSKTNATFSVSGGTLRGLPSNMTALDVLVTIGI